jgi:molecular chaperone HtpG
MSTATDTREFQTEARQLLDLMIHSVYSNKDIFLRELISNASDALDKRRFEAVKDPALLEGSPELHIRLEPNAAERTLTIHDNGIGMSRDEVIAHIGTIAKSGTREYLQRMKANQEAVSAELIGQFGVGFYSSFMVADRVTLVTRRAGEDTATRWESEGAGTYTLADAERDEPGTSVTLHLKPADEEDALRDYTDEWTIREIVKKYSDFVAYPIRMNIERTEIERNEDGTPKEGAEERTVVECETLNSMKAIWLRDKDEVGEDELNEFYKHISHDWNEPLEVIRAKIEGTLEYRLLLFIPSKAPWDLFQRDGRFGLNLYVKRVFIMDDCRDLVPEYLRFVRGVVDSEDLSLNVSREILQQDRQVRKMSNGIVNKILGALKDLKERDTEKYRTFWSEFGRVLKEGLFGDSENREALLDLVLASSTHDAEALTSLRAYVDRMKPGQEAIYYITAETRDAAENSPHIEAFRDRGYEVLLLTDPVDDVWLSTVHAFDGKPFKSIAKGEVDLGSEEEKKEKEEKRKEQSATYGSLLERLQKDLDEHVKEVRLSERLTTSAACLVGEAHDLSPQLEKLMQASGQAMPRQKRILEINPNHAILAKLREVFDRDADAPALKDYAELLYGQALLAEGGELPNPGRFSRLVAEVMVKAL